MKIKILKSHDSQLLENQINEFAISNEILSVNVTLNSYVLYFQHDRGVSDSGIEYIATVTYKELIRKNSARKNAKRYMNRKRKPKMNFAKIAKRELKVR